jgi:hypothetical protein
MKMERTECSETSAYKIQAPGNYPEENIQGSLIFYLIEESRRKDLEAIIGTFSLICMEHRAGMGNLRNRFSLKRRD